MSYTIPNVIAQHSRGERIMDVYSHLLTERIIVLGTAIDPGVANTLTAQLIFLEGQSPDQEINLYINCEGGDIPSMLAIYDTMQYVKAPVVTTCVGQAVARLETEAILGALAKRVELFELTAEPKRRLNNTLRGFDTLPLRIETV